MDFALAEKSVQARFPQDIEQTQKVADIERSVSVQIEIRWVEVVQAIALAQRQWGRFASQNLRIPIRSCTTSGVGNVNFGVVDDEVPKEVRNVHPS